MKNLLSTSTSFIYVTIQNIQKSFFDETNKKVICKMNDKSEGKMIDEFVGIKSKMYSLKNIDGKESNTVKRVKQENNQSQNEKNTGQKT